MCIRIAILICVALTSSCQTGATGADRFAAVVLPEPAAGAIAADLCGALVERKPRTTSTIRLKSDGGAFGIALANALKSAGYQVSPPARENDQMVVALAYSVQSADSRIFAALSTPFITLSRVYSLTPQGATPASALSIIERN